MTEVSTFGTGAVLTLSANGMMDTFLTSNETTAPSFFQFTPQQHTMFTKYNAAYIYENPVTPGWPFGNKITFHLNPKTMGDLLANMYIKLSLPPGNYIQDNLGFSLIKSLEFRLDDQIIETVQSDWNIIYKELYCLNQEKAAINALFQNPGDLMIPLQFFFDRKHSTKDTGNPLIHDPPFFKPYFLTCACYKVKELAISVTFNDPSVFCTSGSPEVPSVTLVTEEIILSQEEKHWIQVNKQEQLITKVSSNPSYKSKGTFSTNLVVNGPIKCMFWYFRNKPGFDFSSNVSECKIYFNNIAMQMKDPYYFKYAQPNNHALSTPNKNIYTCSFCINPKNPAPSGALDFSQLDSDATKITGVFTSDEEFETNVFFVGYNMLRYYDGKVSLGFT
jgi:hypothetical protein